MLQGTELSLHQQDLSHHGFVLFYFTCTSNPSVFTPGVKCEELVQSNLFSYGYLFIPKPRFSF